MALLDDLTRAGQDALSAGVTAARGQGAALAKDFETLLAPNLQAAAAQVASITEARIAGTISSALAQANLRQQFERIGDLIVAEAELALLAVQAIINAVLEALTAVVNAATSRAIGVALI